MSGNLIMGMLTKTAAPQEYIRAATATGNTGGGATNTLWTNGQGWVELASALITYVTGSASTPQPTFQIRDSQGNVLWSNAAAALTASSTSLIALGEGLPNSTTTNTAQVIGLPADTWVPPGGTLTVVINGTAIATDTIAANLVFAQ
jgi:hypothetical protein